MLIQYNMYVAVIELGYIQNDAFASLVVSLVLDPATGVTTDQRLSDLVIGEDDQGEGHGDEPPSPFNWIHAQHRVSARAIGQESGQTGLFEQTGDHDLRRKLGLIFGD